METCRTKVLGFSLLLGGLVLCGIGLWLVFSPAQYYATVKIGTPDSANATTTWYGYADPLSIHGEIERIQSPAVLQKASDVLAASKIMYGNGISSRQTNLVEDTRVSKRQLAFSIVPATNNGPGYGSVLKLIEIRVSATDPDRALCIADAIQRAYREFRFEWMKQMTRRGIEALSERYEKEEQTIKTERELVETQRHVLHVPSPEPAEETLRTNYWGYWQAKLNLEMTEDSHKLLNDRIESERAILELRISQVVDPLYSTIPVIEPWWPVDPNRFVGVSLFTVGLFPTVGGFFLLKSSRRQFT